MFVGYARDSGVGRSLATQLRALSDAGCAKIFSQKKSGTAADTWDPLQAALDFVREGDTLVVTRHDPLAKSNDLHAIIGRLIGKGVNVRYLDVVCSERHAPHVPVRRYPAGKLGITAHVPS